MRIEVLCIGDELLDGRTRDGNAAWFGSRLARDGLQLAQATLVADAPDEIIQGLERATVRADYLLVTGGLGPTLDDRTRQAAADWMGVALDQHVQVLEQMRERYASFGREFPATNARQALFPHGVEVLATEVGTAAGFRARHNDCVIDFVPGVPRECKWFCERYTLPVLGPAADDVISRRWKLFGVGESEVARRLDTLDLGGCVLHYQAHFPEVHLVLKARGAGAEAEMSRVAAEIDLAVGAHLIAHGDEHLMGRLAAGLIKKGLTVATAESCTGGQIAQELTAVAGSSAYMLEGWVTYSNRAKVDRLGVKSQTLDDHGAVAAQTAREMAMGARERAGASVGLAVTGIAGPGGGTPEKPIGTVYMAIATPDGGWWRKLSLGPRSRGQVRTLTTWSVLSTLLWIVEDRLPDGGASPF